MDYFGFNLLLDWLSQHSNWLGIIIGLTAFLESLLLMGLLLPGVVMLFAFTTIAGALKLNLAVLLIWGFVGAVLGDSVSFWIGCKFKQDIYKINVFASHPFWLKKGVDFFNKYGYLSIALGRFIGPIRPFIPTVAGILGMRATQFYIVNIISSIPWAFAYIMPGYYSGYYSESLLSKLSQGVFADIQVTMLVITLVSVVLAWLVTEIIFICKKLLPDNFKQWLLGVLLTLIAIFIKYFYDYHYIELNSLLLSQDSYEVFISYALSYYKYVLYIMALLILYLAWSLKRAKEVSVINYVLYPLSCCLLIFQLLYLHPDLSIWTIIKQNYILSFMLQSLISCMLLLLISTSIQDNKITKLKTWGVKILYITALVTIFFAAILAAVLGLLEISDILVNILLGMLYAQTLKLMINNVS